MYERDALLLLVVSTYIFEHNREFQQGFTVNFQVFLERESLAFLTT